MIPALVLKFHDAAVDVGAHVEVWGDGSARRDFLHATDQARALVAAAESYDDPMPLKIAYGWQHSIRDAVVLLSDISGYRGKIFWNIARLSGQASRALLPENARRHLARFRPAVDLRTGLTRTYRWFESNYRLADARL